MTKKAFTLLELMVSVAIAIVISIVVLFYLNPEEVQKKARDSKRIKDAMTLQGILDQTQRSDLEESMNIDSINGVTSQNVALNDVSCDNTNWLGFDICKFTSTAPLDPLNGTISEMVKGDGKKTGIMYYQVKFRGGDYEINVRQESLSNANKVINDEGDSDEWFEVFSGNNNLFD